MQLEEHTPAYRGFLRSGSYPALSQHLRKSGELAGRMASLVAVAALAAGAGYKVTQRVVTPASGASSASVGPLPTTRHGIGALSVVHAPKPAAAEPALQPAAARPEPQPLPTPAGASSPALTPGKRSSASHEQPARQNGASARKRPSEPVATSAEPAPREPSSPAPEQVRAEQIAERVRALDTAMEASHAAVAARAPQAPAPASDERPVAPKAPAASVQSALPLRAATSILALEVRGSLAASNVRHGLSRVQPALASCYAQAAQQAKKNEFGRVQLRFTIDETGRARAPKVGPAPLPGLEDCLRSAVGKLVCKAPDTGTVQATLLLDFAP